ncbi:MAG: OpgC family protein [Hyphomicrobiaceae bacterium]
MQNAKPRIRDPRLDFFRGIGMFIIFIAHLPGNPWTLWIPARFGFSDATEIFVFCSGMASAIAFGAVFDRHGWLVGAARVLYRAWQVYWSQIIVFFVILAMLYAVDATGYFQTHYDRNFVGGLNLQHFLDRPGENLVGLLTLNYVPNYFDILPMYIVILAMMPIVMALAKIRPAFAMAACVLTWLAVSQPWLVFLNVPVFQGLNLPAEPWSDRTWFFNPFAWQLVFFTGFAFMRGWIPPPPVSRRLVVLAIAIVLITIPFAYFRLLNNFPDLRAIRSDLGPLTSKTFFGLFRYIHFLAIAYLAWIAAGAGGKNLPAAGWPGRVVETVKQVGQQSLAVFLVSLVIARLAGIWLITTDRGFLIVALINFTGFAILIATARITGWYKSTPWKSKPAGQVSSRASDDARQADIQGALAAPDKR